MAAIETMREIWWVRQLVASGVLIALVAFLRWFLAVKVNHSNIQAPDLRRRWHAQIRNAAFFLILIGLFAIWSTELRALAISLLAIVVAIVLATKELILCLTGSILKARSGSFTIGDRIEVGVHRGDVVDQTLLSTRIAELGSGPTAHRHTGRTITIPNSLFLTAPLINESFLGGFVFRSLTIEAAADSDWQDAERRLLAAAESVCAPLLEGAREALARRVDQQGMDAMTVEAKVVVAVPTVDKVQLILRFPAPLGKALTTEQEILRRYLESVEDAPRPVGFPPE